MIRKKIIILSFFAFFLLSSCAPFWGQKNNLADGKISGETQLNTQRQDYLRGKLVNPSINTFFSAEDPAEGSLWTESGNMLFVDKRARKIGDTIIVDILENASSEVNANTKTSRSNEIDAGINNLFGLFKNDDHLVKAGYENDFKGEGSSDRSSTLKAAVGARVIEILPNGNIVIYGKKEIKVNQESQYITVSGIIRSQDISADNRIESTKMADAQIEYSGEGIIANKQKQGWLISFLEKIWPF